MANSFSSNHIIFYSAQYEQDLLDQYLPGVQSRSEFMTSDDFVSQTESIETLPDSIDMDSKDLTNGNSPTFYSPDYEQSLMDEYLPECQSRADFMASHDFSDTSSSSVFTSDLSNDFEDEFIDFSYESKEIVQPSTPENKIETRLPSTPMKIRSGRVHRRRRNGSKIFAKMAVFSQKNSKAITA